jgi:hypothetical protein
VPDELKDEVWLINSPDTERKNYGAANYAKAYDPTAALYCIAPKVPGAQN